jgi:hypothetical protein
MPFLIFSKKDLHRARAPFEVFVCFSPIFFFQRWCWNHVPVHLNEHYKILLLTRNHLLGDSVATPQTWWPCVLTPGPYLPGPYHLKSEKLVQQTLRAYHVRTLQKLLPPSSVKPSSGLWSTNWPCEVYRRCHMTPCCVVVLFASTAAKTHCWNAIEVMLLLTLLVPTPKMINKEGEWCQALPSPDPRAQILGFPKAAWARRREM